MQELLGLTPAYTIVGIYRLLHDPIIRTKVWKKIQHGVKRGAIVGGIWAIATFGIQRAFVRLFLMSTPRVAGISHDQFFGYEMNVATYATLIFISSQVQGIIRFFLGKNLRIARERAWTQVLTSRGKSADFWGPYVEEWEVPPTLTSDVERSGGAAKWEKWVQSSFGRLLIRKVILFPLDVYPGVGLIISSAIKSLGTAKWCHKPYFDSKKMSPHEVALFVSERKTSYYAFGFAAALFEAIPFIGMFFSITNRIGACMWAFDLEKRQHLVAQGQLKRLAPRETTLTGPGVSDAHFSGTAGSSSSVDYNALPEKPSVD